MNLFDVLRKEFDEAKFPITDLKQGVKINGIQQTDDAVLYARAIEIVNKVEKEFGSVIKNPCMPNTKE